jgi:hypothetical protein
MEGAGNRLKLDSMLLVVGGVVGPHSSGVSR